MSNYNLSQLAEIEMGMASELEVTEMSTVSEPTYKERYDRVSALRLAMNQSFIEREQLITVLFTSLVANDNVAIVGLPGTAKSMGIRAIAANVYNSEMFEFICDKFTKPSDLLGSVSIPDMKNGVDKIRIDFKLGTCHFGFLDEGFKLNGATLNGLLGVLNDKRVWNGTGYTASPMISCIVASNEYPTSKELGALWDRFPLRFHVEPITTDDNFRRLIFESQEVNSPIQLADIYAMQAEVQNCNFSQSAFDVLLELRSQIQALRIYVSDRRWKKAVKILKAYSVLQGKVTVDRESFNILKHMLWDKESQRSKVAEIIDNLPDMVSESQRLVQAWKDEHDAAYLNLVEMWKNNDWMTCKEKVIPACEDFINVWKSHDLMDVHPEYEENFQMLTEYFPAHKLTEHFVGSIDKIKTSIRDARNNGDLRGTLQLAIDASKTLMTVRSQGIDALKTYKPQEHQIDAVEAQLQSLEALLMEIN